MEAAVGTQAGDDAGLDRSGDFRDGQKQRDSRGALWVIGDPSLHPPAACSSMCLAPWLLTTPSGNIFTIILGHENGMPDRPPQGCLAAGKRRWRASENPMERQPGKETGIECRERVVKRLSLKAVSMGAPGAWRSIGHLLGPFSWPTCTGGVAGWPGWPVQMWSESGAVINGQTQPQPPGPPASLHFLALSLAPPGDGRSVFCLAGPCLAVLGNTGPFRGAPRVSRAAGALTNF